MKACDECNVKVDGAHRFCPLCGAHLEESQPFDYPLPHNKYPDLSEEYHNTNLMLRIFAFFSIFGCAVCLLINLLVDASFLWCLIVIGAVVYLWLAIPPLLRRGVNYTKRIMFGALLTCLLVVELDFVIGYDGWSVSYVVPALLSAGILAIGMMVMFNRLKWAQYVLYQVLMGVFGFIPLVLYFMGFAKSLVMVLIAAGLALGSLLVTIIFGDRTIKTEFKRRFHL